MILATPPRVTTGEQRRILVDQDGVIADWGSGFDRAFEQLYPQLPFLRHDERHAWAATGPGQDYRRRSAAVMNTPGFFLGLPPVPGARASLDAMVDFGYQVAICTAPWPSNPTCASDKLTWIDQHFGPKWVDRTIITHDKTLIRGDYLFDDRADITGDAAPTWTQVIVTQPYNTGNPGPRVASIRDWISGIHSADTTRAIPSP